MLLNEIRPAEHLRQFVRLYRLIDFHFPSSVSIPVKMYTPRPEQCIQFYPKDAETVSYPGSGISISDRRATVVGLHNTISQRRVGREFLSFQVVLQPGALLRITNIPMEQLANSYIDAEDIFDTNIRFVNEQLFHARDYAEMVTVVEKYLWDLIKNKSEAFDSVDHTSRLMLQQENYSVDTYLKNACLSQRQFDRKFKERIGIAPKLFLQLVRFDRAFRMKNRFPGKDWLSIGLHCGYYDYQHLAKDYKEFTGYTPAQFFAIDNNSPERVFGDAEV